MEQLIKDLETLMSFKTVTGNRQEADKCIDFVEKAFGDQLQIERGENNGYPYVIGYTRSARTPKLLLTAHLDVVPCAEKQFTLQDTGDTLVGRGTFDMKFGAACYLRLLREIPEILLGADIAILFTFDEEIDGTNGIGALVKDGLKPTISVLPDGSDNFKLEILGKGVWQAKLSKEGLPAHGSRPWEGESPVGGLFEAILEIEKAFASQGRETDTCSVTTIGGGDALNRTPKEVFATLDVRYLSPDTLRASVSTIQDICKHHGVSVTVTEEGDSFQIDTEDSNIKLFESVYEQMFGKKMEHVIVCGSSDTRYLSAVGAPVIMTRPDGGGAHGDNEWISKQGLSDFYDLLKEYVVQCLK